MIKIVTAIGARPQFIKAATVSRAIATHNQSSENIEQIEEAIVHTGQHYDERMSDIFFKELQIPKPVHNLGIGSDSHGKQTAKMLAALEEVLLEETPDLVLSYGDTNSTLAAALAAVKLHIPSAHVEAGLRSFNRRMPEEMNRVVTDHLSNILFCPTRTALRNLEREGIGIDKQETSFDFNHRLVFQVGDVMYDSILFNTQRAQEQSDILTRLVLKEKGYCLASVHRPENTDKPKNLLNILDALQKIASPDLKILLPLHPRTRKCIQESGLNAYCDLSNDSGAKSHVVFTEPVSYLDMLHLENHARAILTDSGGIQKEAFLLKVPCITLRGETEWVETVQAGWNIVTGPDPRQIVNAFSALTGWNSKKPPFSQERSVGADVKNGSHLENPYGDGKAAEQIVRIILKTLKS